jgi:hypothetical protein
MITISDKRLLFHKLLYKMGALECKAEILAGYGVQSTSDLTDAQLDEILNNLRKGLKNELHDKELKQWRSNTLKLLNGLDIYVINGDWSGVNSYMTDSRIAGKKLNECSVEELKEVCRKLRNIARKRAESKKKVFENNLCLN